MPGSIAFLRVIALYAQERVSKFNLPGRLLLFPVLAFQPFSSRLLLLPLLFRAGNPFPCGAAGGLRVRACLVIGSSAAACWELAAVPTEYAIFWEVFATGGDSPFLCRASCLGLCRVSSRDLGRPDPDLFLVLFPCLGRVRSDLSPAHVPGLYSLFGLFPCCDHDPAVRALFLFHCASFAPPLFLRPASWLSHGICQFPA